MPAAYTSQQKSLILQVAKVANIKESDAAKLLKSSNWNAQAAIHSYYDDSSSRTTNGHSLPLGGGRPSAGKSGNHEKGLSKLFDSYQSKSDDKDQIGVEGTMKYAEDLGLSLEEAALCAIMTVVRAPTMGELTRRGFVEGWSEANCGTLDSQRDFAEKARKRLISDDDYHLKVYKYTFNLGLPNEANARVIPLETAVAFWRLLLSDPLPSWKSELNGQSVDWLELWISYLEQDFKKAINRDLWDQTYLFAAKTKAEPDLAWHDGMEAWPTVIDDFVAHVRKQRK